MYDEKERFNQEFGRRCRLARGNRRMEDVAEQAGITPQFLSSVERGKKGMTGMNIANLARALNVTSDYLLYGRTDADAAWVMVIWGAVAMFRRVAEPKFVGNQTGLSPILSLISIYVGMKLAGVAGMILGPIVTLVALNLLGLGLLDGWKADLRAALEDIRAILGRREEP